MEAVEDTDNGDGDNGRWRHRMIETVENRDSGGLRLEDRDNGRWTQRRVDT